MNIPDHVPAELVRPFNFSDGLGDRPHEVIGDLHREARIFYSPTHYHNADRGAWVLTHADDIRRVLQDAETFSSQGTTGRSGAAGAPLIPVELDPPEHSKFRALMNPLFSPARIKAMEGSIREQAVALITEIAPRGECDFVVEFAQKFPAMIFADLMGLPSAEIPRFLAWEHKILGGNAEVKRLATQEIVDYLRGLCAERRARPTEDLVTFAVNARIDGRLLTDDEVQGMTFLLFIAGLDTVASSLGWQIRYLAENQQDQDRLRAQPELLPNAMEEMLRAFSVVSPSRFVTRDVEIAYVTLRKGDLVVCSTIAANRDPAEFSSPAVLDLERSPNRHNAFSSGPHRCIGSHLARREMIIAHEEWARRVPSYRMRDGAGLKCHGGSVVGLDTLPLVWS